MSYSEENGQVVLRMSREDYLRLLGLIHVGIGRKCGVRFYAEESMALLDRLNSGNPNYTPYQVGDKPNG